MKTKDEFNDQRSEPRAGHDYMPDWISVPFFVDHISGGIAYGEFYTGHHRHFRVDSFNKSFKHYDDCLMCKREIHENKRRSTSH